METFTTSSFPFKVRHKVKTNPQYKHRDPTFGFEYTCLLL